MSDTDPIEVPKTKIIKIIRKIGWDVDRTIANGDTSEVMFVLVNIPPLATSKVLDLEITWGLTDDPIDERLKLAVMYLDPAITPSAARVAREAVWIDAQNWRSIGTDAGPIQTLRHYSPQIKDDRIRNTHPLTERDHDNAYCVIQRSNFTSPMLSAGTIVVSIWLTQRTWRDDDSFKDVMESDKSITDEECLHHGHVRDGLSYEEVVSPLWMGA